MKFDKKEAKRIEEITGKALDILVPRLSEHYDLEIRKPLIGIRPDDFIHSAGTITHVRIDGVKIGQIRLMYSACREKRTNCRYTAHELGHITSYQNCDDEFLYQKDPFSWLDEGIATDFEFNGLNTLYEGNYLSTFDTFRENLSLCWSLVLPDKYSVGFAIVRDMKKKGVAVKDLIINPQEYRDEIVSFLKENFRNYYEAIE